MIPKSKIYAMALVTLLGFPLIAVTIVGFAEDNPFDFEWIYIRPLWEQAGIGILYGLLAGFIAWGIIKTDFMKPIRHKYGGLIKKLNLNFSQIVFLSLCAGIGEEILFRAVIQQYWGIWITAIVFVAIHGYLNPSDKRISVYGFVMTILIAGIGYLYQYIGIVTAITAHTIIDIVLFTKLTGLKTPDEQEPREQESFHENIEQPKQDEDEHIRID